MKMWKGKLAVVTGASAGIGAAIVEELAKAGINVVGLARRVSLIDEVIQNIGTTPGKVYAYHCDVSDLQSIKAAFKWIEEKFGSMNILINNAGCGRNVNILTEDDVDESLKQIIDTNFTGLVQTTRHAYRLMKKSDDYGYIININSIAGHVVPFPADGVSRSNVYHGTKHAVTATSEILRQELVCMKNDKIRVSSISPGVVETEFFGAAGFLPTDFKISTAMPALKASDISNVVMFLLSTPNNVNVTELTVKPVGEQL